MTYLYSVAGNRSVHPASCNLLMAKDILMATLSEISPCAWGLVSLGPCGVLTAQLSEGVPNYCQGNSISGACGNGGEAEFQLKATLMMRGR